ncbi:MAG TPA: ADOP family duplicated permease [Vicinamibacterales bacterium]|nr:ADOP family duplicated permease [Vicinamibacterales bacterium]
MTADSLVQDLRHGLRLMRRNPGFSMTAALVLSLGIGVNTALFSIVNSVFFRDRHVPQPENIVLLYAENLSRELMPLMLTGTGNEEMLLNEKLADYSATWVLTVPVAVGDDAESTRGEMVNANYFDVLAVAPEMGRGFRAEEDDPSNTEYSIVVSDVFWRTRLNGDPNAIGRQIRVSDKFYRVVGVTPPQFGGVSDYLLPSHFWVTRAQFRWGTTSAGYFGRLKPGVTFKQFQAFVLAQTPAYREARVRGLKPDTREQFKEWQKYGRLPVYRWTDVAYPRNPTAQVIPPRILTALATVVALILVIAAANIAGLLLARGVTRTSEVAVRRALGADGSRLMRQLLTESVLLACAGGALGAIVASALVVLFRTFAPPALSIDVHVDSRVLLFAIILCVGAGVMVGIAPALQAARVNVLEALGAGIAGARRVRTRLRHGIVVPQIALSLVLLVVAAIHVRSLLDIELNNLGYRTDGNVVLSISRWEPSVPPAFRPTGDDRVRAENELSARIRAFNRGILARLADIPNVTNFAIAGWLPFWSFRGDLSPVISQEALLSGEPARIGAFAPIVSDGYFDVMGMRLLRGRTFDDRDTYGGRPVTVISERLAARLWPTGDPIGKRVALQPSSTSQRITWLEVIGVVNEVDPVLDDAGERPMMYTSLLQQWRGTAGNLIVRGAGNQAELIKAVKAAVVGADAFAEVTRVQTMRQMVAEILYPRRVAAAILLTAGVIGLALACIGLYGVMSYSIAQRRREIGIRATLGADRGDIIRLVLREGAVVTVLGIAAGGALTFAALRLSANALPGVPVLDVISFVTVPFVLVSIVVAACLVPAFRAANADPANVLRGA